MAPYRIAVLASGSGSLFQALIDNQAQFNAQIVALISDVECPAINRATQANIPTQVISVDQNRAAWDHKLVTALTLLNPDLIVSAGFMRLLGPEVLAKFEGRIINTHPALLPNFPGAHAVRDALAAGAKQTGSTIHFVDSGMDTGEVIAQSAVEILDGDSEELLHERIKQVERELLVQVVSDFVSGKIKPRSRS